MDLEHYRRTYMQMDGITNTPLNFIKRSANFLMDIPKLVSASHKDRTERKRRKEARKDIKDELKKLEQYKTPAWADKNTRQALKQELKNAKNIPNENLRKAKIKTVKKKIKDAKISQYKKDPQVKRDVDYQTGNLKIDLKDNSIGYSDRTKSAMSRLKNDTLRLSRSVNEFGSTARYVAPPNHSNLYDGNDMEKGYSFIMNAYSIAKPIAKTVLPSNMMKKGTNLGRTATGIVDFITTKKDFAEEKHRSMNRPFKEHQPGMAR